MLRITVTTKTKIDTGRPNLTVAEINLLLPFTITGIPDELSDDQRDAINTSLLVPLRRSITPITA